MGAPPQIRVLPVVDYPPGGAVIEVRAPTAVGSVIPLAAIPAGSVIPLAAAGVAMPTMDSPIPGHAAIVVAAHGE